MKINQLNKLHLHSESKPVEEAKGEDKPAEQAAPPSESKPVEENNAKKLRNRMLKTKIEIKTLKKNFLLRLFYKY